MSDFFSGLGDFFSGFTGGGNAAPATFNPADFTMSDWSQTPQNVVMNGWANNNLDPAFWSSLRAISQGKGDLSIRDLLDGAQTETAFRSTTAPSFAPSVPPDLGGDPGNVGKYDPKVPSELVNNMPTVPPDLGGPNTGADKFDPKVPKELQAKGTTRGLMAPGSPEATAIDTSSVDLSGLPKHISKNPVAVGQAVYKFFRAKGLPPHQAAAIAGNMAHESGGSTYLINPGDNWKNSPRAPHSYGIAQWNDRIPDMLRMIKEKGIQLPPGDLRDTNYIRSISNVLDFPTQLEFAWREMQTTENRAFRGIAASQTLEQAAANAVSYHRPFGWTWAYPAAGHGFANRLGLARRIFALEGGK